MLVITENVLIFSCPENLLSNFLSGLSGFPLEEYHVYVLLDVIYFLVPI